MATTATAAVTAIATAAATAQEDIAITAIIRYCGFTSVTESGHSRSEQQRVGEKQLQRE
jgi:hypothetical protein